LVSLDMYKKHNDDDDDSDHVDEVNCSL
jgi:hypothetical protein